MSRPWTRSLAAGWPFLVLSLLAVLFVLMLIFSRKAPVIASIDPPMAAPGETVVLVGDYFGRTEREGSLSLAGEIPPPSLIRSWSDQRIEFTVPEDASSGLVTISNSQGTSTGVLFTNTNSIPTVLQAASAPGIPLMTALVPPQPAPGELVTVTGRGFGSGEGRGFVRVQTGAEGPQFAFAPADCTAWLDRAVSFRWPAGAGAGTVVSVVTARGQTSDFSVDALSPVVFENPRTVKVDVSVSAALPAGSPTVFWVPMPAGTTGTAWSTSSALPLPLEGASPLLFRWAGGAGGERRATVQLVLKTWARRWDSLPAGVPSAADAPRPDERLSAWWKPSQPTLKTLVSKWGLETSDPWLRAQRLHSALTTAFQVSAGGTLGVTLGRTAAEILATRTLDSVEASSLGGYLAAQTGIPARLVSGLWSDAVAITPRVWVELWFSGAGWVSWDPNDGPPGPLDNRHFAFLTSYRPPIRLEAKAKMFGTPAPWGQGQPLGEAVWSGQEPVVQWEIKRSEK